jgi:hypothetical protein
MSSTPNIRAVRICACLPDRSGAGVPVVVAAAKKVEKETAAEVVVAAAVVAVVAVIAVVAAAEVVAATAAQATNRGPRDRSAASPTPVETGL